MNNHHATFMLALISEEWATDPQRILVFFGPARWKLPPIAVQHRKAELRVNASVDEEILADPKRSGVTAFQFPILNRKRPSNAAGATSGMCQQRKKGRGRRQTLQPVLLVRRPADRHRGRLALILSSRCDPGPCPGGVSLREGRCSRSRPAGRIFKDNGSKFSRRHHPVSYIVLSGPEAYCAVRNRGSQGHIPWIAGKLEMSG